MTDTANNLSQLATTLFDLRAALESELRTLTWVQRSLDGIRDGRPGGDVDLLLREIARLFNASDAAAATASDHRSTAATLVAAVRTAQQTAAEARASLSIVAA